jgi:hypothetical protein
LNGRNITEGLGRPQDILLDAAVGGIMGGVSYGLGKIFSRSPAAGGGCSFSEDTLVQTSNGPVPIEDVQVGDMVLGFDTATGITAYFAVTATFSHEDPEVVFLTIDGELVETTPGHPFYTESGWVPAGELMVGARIRRVDGSWGLVQGVELVVQTRTMLNLTVETAHTFFVGSQAWLVHNGASCPLNPGGRRGSPAHQSRILDAADQLAPEGGPWKVVSGGRLPERGVRVPSGGMRYPDLVLSNGTSRIAVQVGRVTQALRPVAREIRALADLRATGLFKHVFYLRYR